MADEKTILLKIELDKSQLEKSAEEAEKSIISIRAEMAKLKDENKEGGVEYAKLRAELQKSNKQMADSAKALNTLELQQAKETGSLREMRDALSAAKIQFQELSAEQRASEGGQKMVQGMLELKNAINDVEQSFGTFTGSVGNYEAAQIPLRKQLREVVQQMQALHAAGQEDSESFRELSARAGALRDSMDAVTEQVKTLATGTAFEANLKVMKGGFEAVMGGAQTAEGAMQLFGSESEEVQRGIQKMVALEIQAVASPNPIRPKLEPVKR
jgi:chromosome segregation ATPase